VAELAADSGRADYARDADVSWLAARLRNKEAPRDDDEGAEEAIIRYLSGHPELSNDPSVAWPALLAAGKARASIVEPTELATAPRELHPLVGQMSPPLHVVSLSGGQRSLEELRGRVVVVDFWASWCGPCKRALPQLQAAANELSDKPVTFLLVSVDAQLDAAQEFMAESSYTMDAVWAPDGTKTKKEWTVKGIPSTFIIDVDGLVKHHYQGYSREAGEQIHAEVLDLLH
jgi:thiol-disulfide isomerase/thioredoxin